MLSYLVTLPIKNNIQTLDSSNKLQEHRREVFFTLQQELQKQVWLQN